MAQHFWLHFRLLKAEAHVVELQASGRARRWPSRLCRARRSRTTTAHTKASSRRSRCTAAATLLLPQTSLAHLKRITPLILGNSCKTRRCIYNHGAWVK
jgi:hypothetical protein